MLTRLLKMDLNPESQTRIADHVVGELTGDAGTLEDMAQVVTVLVQMNDVPGPRRMEYARSLDPLMTVPSTPNGQEITVADRCAIAAAIRACNRDNQESSQFLTEQAKKGVSPAYVMIGLCNATEAIPVLVERLKMAENEPEILMLIMALNRMSVDVSVRQQIGIAREKLSPMARAFIQKQLKVNNAPITESPAE